MTHHLKDTCLGESPASLQTVIWARNKLVSAKPLRCEGHLLQQPVSITLTIKASLSLSFPQLKIGTCRRFGETTYVKTFGRLGVSKCWLKAIVSHISNIFILKQYFLLVSHRFLVQEKEDPTPTGKPNDLEISLAPRAGNFKCRLSHRASWVQPAAGGPGSFLWLYSFFCLVSFNLNLTLVMVSSPYYTFLVYFGSKKKSHPTTLRKNLLIPLIALARITCF